MKRRVDGIGLEAGNEAGCLAIAAAHRPVMLEQNLRVILLAAAQRTADGVEPEQLRGLDRLWGQVLVFQGASPFRDGVREQLLRFGCLV